MLWYSPAFLSGNSSSLFTHSHHEDLLVFLPTSTSRQRLVSRFLFSPFLFVMIGENTHCCSGCFFGVRSFLHSRMIPRMGRSLFLWEVHLSEREKRVCKAERTTVCCLWFVSLLGWRKAPDSIVHNSNRHHCPTPYHLSLLLHLILPYLVDFK